MWFSKMHGLGNDFIILDGINQNIQFSSKLIKKLSNRNTGIGFDQLLIVESSNNPKLDFNYRIFNANGNEVTQCGNGARCFAYFVQKKGLTKKKKIHVSTKTGNIIMNIIKNNKISVNMGKPNFKKKITFHLIQSIKEINDTYKNLNIKLFGIVSIGNPHCVIQVTNINSEKIKLIGSILEKNKCFPERANIGFIKIITKKCIKLRVYERDVGETKACGSGACAAVAIGIQKKILSNKVHVKLLGGNLSIYWKGKNDSLFMIGPATHVYDGFIKI
ncbi:Diaminopimelate epimerase [Serratia symbiotica]|nr:Diaminopimelate epimerase [Serratia symbiotica]